VLHGRSADPVDSWVAADSSVRRINHDAFEPLVSAIFTSPIRVEESKVSASLTSSLFSQASEGSGSSDTLDTLVGWLSVYNTVWIWSLSGTSLHTDSVDNKALLGLVSQSASLVHSSWSGASVNDVQLTEFPASHTHHEAHDIGLLLLVQFLNVFISTHR